MTTPAKVLIIIILVLSLVFAAMSAALFTQRHNWRQQYVDANSQLKKARSDLQDAQQQIKKRALAYEQKIRVQDAEIGKLTTMIETLKTDKARLQERANKIAGDLQKLTEDQNNIATQLKEERGLRLQLEKKVAALEKDRDDARQTIRDQRQKIEQLEASNKDLNRQIVALKSKINDLETDNGNLTKILNKLVDEGLAPVDVLEGVPLPPIDGKILSVDPVRNIIVINRGKKDGVRGGYRFTIYRGDEYVGRLLIENAVDDLAYGRALPEYTRKKVQVGDDVSTRME